MRKEIVINAAANETRIAITEEGRLAELFVENPNKEKMVGDIYLGRVAKVMPGIKAAFIDVGLNQDGFLHFSDIGDRFENYTSLIGDDEAEIDTDEEKGGASEAGVAVEPRPGLRSEGAPSAVRSPHPPADRGNACWSQT